MSASGRRGREGCGDREGRRLTSHGLNCVHLIGEEQGEDEITVAENLTVNAGKSLVSMIFV